MNFYYTDNCFENKSYCNKFIYDTEQALEKSKYYKIQQKKFDKSLNKFSNNVYLKLNWINYPENIGRTGLEQRKKVRNLMNSSSSRGKNIDN